MEQLGISFDLPRARKRDPETSQVAASGVNEFYLDHFARILEALAKPGTIYEIAERTGLTHVQVARRAPEMQAEGLIAPLSNETRLSPSGRACRVWCLT